MRNTELGIKNDEGIGDGTRLSDVAEMVMGQSPPSTSYNASGEGLPFYQGKTDFGSIYPTPRKYCTEPKKVAEAGDILMSVRAPVGTTNLCREKSCIGRGIAAIRAKDIDRDFLYFYLRKIEPYIDSLGSGAIFKAINKFQLCELPINKAGIELPEQKKIAYILSTVQRAIEAQERIIQTTTELKKALMQKLFTEGLRGESQKETEIGLVPESWQVVELGEVINLFSGYAFKSKEGVSKSNTQLLRMGNLYQNRLDLSRKSIFYPDSYAEDHKRFVLKEGDLVMSLTGTSGKEDYGFTVQIPHTEKTLLLNQRVTRIDITDVRLQKDFAHHFLLSRKFLDYLYPTAKGMKQANLSTNEMKKLKVALPDKEEQLVIAMCFKTLDQKISVAGHKAVALREMFCTLLHELMTAKTRVEKLELGINS